jgi:predicted GTPase
MEYLKIFGVVMVTAASTKAASLLFKTPVPSPETSQTEIDKFKQGNGIDERYRHYVFIGKVGVGKSSLINAMIQLRDNEPGSAKVKPFAKGATTFKPEAYEAFELNGIKFWDIPGYTEKDCNVTNDPAKDFYDKYKLQIYKGIILMVNPESSEFERQLIKRILKHGYTDVILVRSQADTDIKESSGDIECKKLHNVVDGLGFPYIKCFILSARNMTDKSACQYDNVVFKNHFM